MCNSIIALVIIYLIHVVYDLLVYMANQGTFVPQPRHGISVKVIRTKEHDGCVHGVGEGINLQLWFGTSRKSTHAKERDERDC